MTGSYATQASTNLYKNTHKTFQEIDIGLKLNEKKISMMIRWSTIYMKMFIKMKSGEIWGKLKKTFEN